MSLIFKIITGENDDQEIIHTCYTPTEVKEFIEAHPDLPKSTRVIEYTSKMDYRDCLCLTFLYASGLLRNLDKITTFWEVPEP